VIVRESCEIHESDAMCQKVSKRIIFLYYIYIAYTYNCGIGANVIYNIEKYFLTVEEIINIKFIYALNKK